MTARRAARYLAYAGAALTVLALAVVFVLPRLLDRPRVAAEIQAKLSQALKGEVHWSDFSVRVLPAPSGVLRGLRVETTSATLTTDEVTVALRLWPLLLGRAEITSLDIRRPVLRLTVVPAAAVPEEAQLAPQKDALAAYRSIVGAIVEALQEFAPDTRVAISDADVSISVEGLPPMEASGFVLRARTSGRDVQVEASARSRYWTAMKLTGRIDYASLASSAELSLVRVQGQAWLDWALKSAGVGVSLPDVDMNARWKADPQKALELELDGTAKTLTLTHGGKRIAASPIMLKARLIGDASDWVVEVARLGIGASGLAGGKVLVSQKEFALSGDLGYRVDLAQALGYARELAPAPLARVDSATGALGGRARFTLRGDERRLAVTIEKSDSSVQVKGVGPVRLTGAAVAVDARAVQAERVAVSLSAGDVEVSKARYAFKDGTAAAQANFDLGLAETLALVRAFLPDPKALDIIESASGRVRGAAKAELTRKAWMAGAEITQSDAQAKLSLFPTPVTLTGATVRATPDAVAIQRASLRIADSTATAAATLTDFSGGPRVVASVSEASIGPRAVAWIWKSAGLAPNFEPKTPIRVSVPHFLWAPKSPLELRAEARFDSGPTVDVDLAWSPQVLELRRATVKDSRSDVSLSVRTRGRLLEGSYGGTLDSRTIAAMLKSAQAPAGAVAGKLDFVFDREQPERTTAQGALKGENVDLSWLAGKPAKIERIDLAADGTTVRIAEATLEWAGQRATLRGVTRHGPQGPVIEAQIDSPGVVVNALLPPAKPATAKPSAPGADPLKALWPLPVTGRIGVRSKFVQYEHYKVEPLSAVIVLEPERAQLEINEAFLCGLALPATLQATPKGLSASLQVAAQNQKLEDAAHCLSGEKVLLTGALNLRADLRTEGKPDELLKNLKGSVSADVRNGAVMKFALIGNILSMQNVVALVGQGGPNLAADSFPFRQLSAKGRFDKGRFLLDEGVFHSNAIGLGANGWISLTDFQNKLTVLVAPLALVDEAVRKLPVLGYVVGGTFTSLPVSVSGDIRDPIVVPLGPRAITSELTGILSRTIKLPTRLVPGEEKP